MKHTPGPWTVTDKGVRDSGGYICFIPETTHYEGQDERYVKEVAERHANARLIAAAPELLETLQTIAAFAVGNGDVCEIIARRARAAIAKAEGAQ